MPDFRTSSEPIACSSDGSFVFFPETDAAGFFLAEAHFGAAFCGVFSTFRGEAAHSVLLVPAGVLGFERLDSGHAELFRLEVLEVGAVGGTGGVSGRRRWLLASLGESILGVGLRGAERPLACFKSCGFEAGAVTVTA